MSGTSRGMLTNYNGTQWDQQSYLSFLDSHNFTVAGYYQTDLWALGYFKDLHTPSMTPKIRELNSHFYDDVAAGKVAQFTWLQPSCHSIEGSPASWQHPDASVMEGERLIKSVYEALRNSPVWEKTLLLITYDEHGGFYDHVPPPSGPVPSPDGVVSPPPQSFHFNQLGVRIPTVAVSPWIKKNTIVSEYLNEAERPTPQSAFDATSIISTVNKMFGIDNARLQFPGRVQWANTFVGLFDDLTEPRKDCPLTLPELPPTPPNHIAEQRAKKLNDHLESQILFYCSENYPALHAIGQCPGKAELFANQGDASDWILAEYDILMARRSIAETKIMEKDQSQVIQ
jgi:phospholipase C